MATNEKPFQRKFLMTKEEKREKLVMELRWHQTQLHHLLTLYYDAGKFSPAQREHNQECTNSTYRHHLGKTAELQSTLNKTDNAVF
jgi:hypothetical protein